MKETYPDGLHFVVTDNKLEFRAKIINHKYEYNPVAKKDYLVYNIEKNYYGKTINSKINHNNISMALNKEGRHGEII